HLPALGPHAAAGRGRRRPRAPGDLPVRALGRGDRDGHRRGRQLRDADHGRGGLPQPGSGRAGFAAGRVPRPGPFPGPRRRCALRAGAAGLGLVVVVGRHHGRSGGDGRLHPAPDPALPASHAHDAARPGRDRPGRRPHARAGAEPGRALLRRALRPDPAGALLPGPGADGRPRQLARRDCASLRGSGRHRLAQRLPPLPGRDQHYLIATAWRAVLVPALGLALCLLAVEWARVLAAREWPLAGQAAGGAALCLCLALYPPGVLGLGRDRLAARLLGAAALTAALPLPAAVRWPGELPLGGGLAAAVVLVAAGEEIAFRGA